MFETVVLRIVYATLFWVIIFLCYGMQKKYLSGLVVGVGSWILAIIILIWVVPIVVYVGGNILLRLFLLPGESILFLKGILKQPLDVLLLYDNGQGPVATEFAVMVGVVFWPIALAVLYLISKSRNI